VTHQVTPETCKMVETAAGIGLPHDTIAKLVGVTGKTLRRKYRVQLDQGMAKAHFNVAKTTYEQAISGRSPTLTIWYEKTRIGMRETLQVTTPQGEPFETAPGEPELIGAYYERLSRAAASGPAGADPGADPGVDSGGQGPTRPRGGPKADQG
jgi:hypothetical protein